MDVRHVALASAALCVASAGHAQQNVVADSSMQPTMVEQAGPPIASPSPSVQSQAAWLQSLLRPIAVPARALAQDGILLRGSVITDLQRNMSGGLEKGTDNAGTATFGADVDLDRLVGLPGAQVHVLFAAPFGLSVQTRTGNYIQTQGLWYPFQRFQLAQLAWEQTLFGGRLDLYGGRVNGTATFARPTYGCAFASGSQCPYYLTLFTAQFSGFPYVTWGGRAQYRFSDRIYAQAGAFAVDPARGAGDSFKFGLSTTTGVSIPFEIGYQTDYSNDRYPRHFKLGGWINTAPWADPLVNTRGQSRVFAGGAPLTHSTDRGGIYALADQVIWRPDSSPRSLAVFASFAAPTDKRQIFTQQSAVGLVGTGLVASRPFDTAGVMLTRADFSRAETTYMDQLLLRNGGPSAGRIARHQYLVEVNYGIHVVPGLTLMPNAQYIANPDILRRLDARTAPRNAFLLGIRAWLSFGDLLGLPAAPRGSVSAGPR